MSKLRGKLIKKSYIDVAIIFFINFSIYLQSVLNSKKFFEKVVPLGDPFTYSIGFYRLIDEAKQDFFGIPKIIKKILSGDVNWYWLQDFLVVVLSPLLKKELYSLILINYILYFIWALLLLKLSKLLKLSRVSSIIISTIPWFFPSNYGLAEYSSPSVMGLDASFTPMLGIAATSLLCLFIDSKNSKLAIFAGVSTSLAVFGRGNSLPVVLIVIFIPYLASLLKCKKNNSYKSLIIYSVISIFGTFFFYFQNWNGLKTYYTAHLNFVERQTWNFNDAAPYLLNIPGFMFWRHENHFFSVILSFAIHGCVLYSVIRTLRSKNYSNPKQIFILAGSFIYFMTYATNILLFTDPLMNIYNALIIWRPMILGIQLILIGYFLGIPQFSKEIERMCIIGLVIFLAFFSLFFNTKQTPLEWSNNRPTVNQMLDNIELMQRYNSVALLWYGNNNPQIYEYYSIKLKSKSFPLYYGKNYNSLWSQWDYSSENQSRIAQQIIESFNESDVVIVPEFIDQYSLGQPFAINQFRQILVDLHRGRMLPKMFIVGRLKESDNSNLIVLARDQSNYPEVSEIWLPKIRENL